jgi:hypothetical protein
MLRNWSASRTSTGTPTDRSLCHTSVALSYRWISTSSLGLFMNANEHNQLTSPILMSTTPCVCLWVYARLAMKACTQACRASTCSLSASRPSPIGTPTGRSLCHPYTINGFNRIVTFRTTFVEPMDANDHSQLTSLSPDIKPCDNYAQCRAHTIHSYAIGLRLSYDL